MENVPPEVPQKKTEAEAAEHNPGYTPDYDLEPEDIFEQSSFYDE